MKNEYKKKSNILKTVILLLLISFIGTYKIYAQVPSLQWQKTYGGTNVDETNNVIQTSDGGYLLLGNSSSTDSNAIGNHGLADILLIKTDANGILQWKKIYGGSGYDLANSIKKTTDGGYIIGASSNSTDGDVTGAHGDFDIWVLKINSLGSIQWQKTFGGSGFDNTSDIIQTSDSNYIIAGFSKSRDGDRTDTLGGMDAWIIKINSVGNIIWKKSYGGSADDGANSIQQLSDGSYIVGGYTESMDGDVIDSYGGGDGWAFIINSAGTIQWSIDVGGSGQDIIYNIQKTSDGGFVAIGPTSSQDGDVTNNHGNYDVWVLKFTATGSIQWKKTYGGANNETSYFIRETSDGEYIFSASSNSINGDVTGNHGGYDLWIVKLKSDGTIKWQKSIGTSGNDYGTEINQTSDNGYIVSGYVSCNDGDVSSFMGVEDFWMAKLAADPLDVESFDLQNLSFSPNPATNQINIQIPNKIFIDRIIISDLTGKKILEVNENTRVVNVEGLASGMYIIEASSGENKFKSKFIKQ